MIGHLSGRLIEKHPPHLLLDVNGIGYEIEASTHTFHQLPEIGSALNLHIHFVVREDAQLFYGFIDRQEKILFRNLIKVNNVGPKLAIGILSGMAPSHFVRCVMDNDTTSLTRIPGVGKKTAERLIIEMRDRLADWTLTEFSPIEKQSSEKFPPLSETRSDAMQALIALGYKMPQAHRAINKIVENSLSSEEMIRQALQQI
jgi:Holliday junction DNA helicase RuvA